MSVSRCMIIITDLRLILMICTFRRPFALGIVPLFLSVIFVWIFTVSTTIIVCSRKFIDNMYTNSYISFCIRITSVFALYKFFYFIRSLLLYFKIHFTLIVV